MSQSGTTHTGSGGGAGKVSVQDISVTKWVDKASPILIQKCAQGSHIDDGELVVRKAGNFSKFTVKYQEQDDKGAAKGGSVDFTFNIAENAAA
jgi:type VI secretion system secreted protein Hcp